MTDTIWVFNGEHNAFPSAVFSSKENALEWIKAKTASGVLTAYPLDIGVYDWAIEKEYFTPKKEHEFSPRFISSFSTASQVVLHYQDGVSLDELYSSED